VLDLRQGLVVRAVAGDRARYQPLTGSRLVASSDPLTVARAFRHHGGFTDLYLADLDAIAGHPPAEGIVRALVADGWRLAVDAGVRTAADARRLHAEGVARVVVGLETLAGGPAMLQTIVADLGPAVVFSLDLRDGEPLGDRPAWGGADALGVAGQAVAAGVTAMLFLDLRRVGAGAGTGTEELCRRVRSAHPGVAIWAGGGVRDQADLDRLADAGVTVALVASALHAGRIATDPGERGA
jgi:phosphoribosylformimino-5-aminoimidazole carboxamide ribotide isomerase